MMPVKEAVEKAVEFAQSVLHAPSMLLEEVESGKGYGRDVWLITLSMPKREPRLTFNAFADPRDYKTFTVDRNTGEVLAMKIRELGHAATNA